MSDKKIIWRCSGYDTALNQWCGYIMTNLEMQSHKFDLGCPRCGSSFGDFKVIEENVDDKGE